MSVYQTCCPRFEIFLKDISVRVTHNILPMDGNEIGVVEYFCPLTVYIIINQCLIKGNLLVGGNCVMQQSECNKLK